MVAKANYRRPSEPTPRYRPARSYADWSRDEEMQLANEVEEGWSVARIAQKHRRGLSAIRVRMNLKSLYPRRSADYSIDQIMVLFRVSRLAVISWLKRGWLTASYPFPQTTDGRREARVSVEAAWAFVENPATWVSWMTESITNADLRAHAEETRGNVTYLRTTDAASLTGYSTETLRNACRLGKLTSTFYRGCLYWRSDDLDRFLAERESPDRPRKIPHSWQEDEIAFLRAWRPVQPICYLADALGRADSSVKVLCDRLGLTGPKQDPIELSQLALRRRHGHA